jgi:hypothetical protein
LFGPPPDGPIVPGRAGELPHRVERPGSSRRRSIVGGERTLEVTAAFDEMTTDLPEVPERARHLQDGLRLAGSLQSVEGGPQVVVLTLESVVPWRVLLPLHGLRLFREHGEMPRVTPANLVRLARSLQPLEGVLADRLEHPEPVLRMAHEALVDERLERVEIGVDDLLRGLERATTDEDGEAREQGPFRIVEEVVGPSDRGPERLLPRIGVASALEQIEPPGQPLDDLCR